ncbi:hypothetical protein COU77_02845 [Candidatus Peregrinibacteria bacterium CG10_big_fil_rev_8_21_14_0_10_49_16]|nr:MAG: hypothetical protein COW95_02360 [Candidatus Peregrinibacteria bacterium CG22_combo_CG10-13_8_21_14_all_49_11]PIR51975.1 MAG: hypothetical protein COU77_02845 [Candidatus Peregrinibacteria bacterium CG10_big_fil_rev_8_21_14_0_10_49_16]
MTSPEFSFEKHTPSSSDHSSESFGKDANSIREAAKRLLQHAHVEKFCRTVADTIGVEPQTVVEFVERARRGQFLFHGVKRASALPLVYEKGVDPVTPEGAASYWTSGMAFFGDPSGTNDVDRFFNATFYNYAHVQGTTDADSTMVIALTTADDVRRVEQDFSFITNAELAVHKRVSPEMMQLIVVRCPQDRKDKTLWMNQTMFHALSDAMSGQYAPGTVTVYNPKGRDQHSLEDVAA